MNVLLHCWYLVGGDSGLDGLGGPGVQLGSPDKKKRKANTQVNSFASFEFLINSALKSCLPVWVAPIVQNINFLSQIAATYQVFQFYFEVEIFLNTSICAEVILIPVSCQRHIKRGAQWDCNNLDFTIGIWFWGRLFFNDFVAIGRNPYSMSSWHESTSYLVFISVCVGLWANQSVQFVNALTKLLAYSPGDFQAKAKSSRAPFQWILAMWHFYAVVLSRKENLNTKYLKQLGIYSAEFSFVCSFSFDWEYLLIWHCPVGIPLFV